MALKTQLQLQLFVIFKSKNNVLNTKSIINSYSKTAS